MLHPKSTLRLPGLKNEACSGLTLSGAPLFRPFKAGLGAAEWVKLKTITFFRSVKEKDQFPFSIFQMECFNMRKSIFFK